MTIRRLNQADRFIGHIQNAIQSLAGPIQAARPYPVIRSDPGKGLVDESANDALDDTEKRQAGALMRVNHVGEICAQALYQGQAITTRNTRLRAQFEQAAAEERDHLAWTAQRLRELNTHQSLLNPVWYAGSLVIGTLAGKAGDKASLGFMNETERQVEQHLAGHLNRLPTRDWRSRQIVAQMKQDEARHAAEAQEMGGSAMPVPIRQAMRLTARIMTSVSQYI